MKSALSRPFRPIPIRIALIAAFIVVAVCAIFLRFSNLDTPLLDFHPTRQLFGAIKARGIYYQTATEIPDWKKEIASKQIATEAVIEPPLMEITTAALYKRFGENTAIPRAISASAWLIGAIFLILLAKDLSSSWLGSLAAAVTYLFLPYGIKASTAFQPDPLMIALILLFWWCFGRWTRKDTWYWALCAGIAGGLAIFIKFTAVFFIASGAFGLLFTYRQKPVWPFPLRLWFVVLLGALPAGIYLLYGTFVDPFLVQQFGGRFFLEKWIDPYFYLKWIITVDNVIPFGLAVAATLGLLVYVSNAKRTLYAWLLGGYFAFGMVFSHHISSHDYYSLPLVPILALLVGELAALVVIGDPNSRPTPEHIPAGWLYLSFLFLALYTITNLVELRSERAKLVREVKVWEEIGDTIGHQPGVISLTTDYGYALEYYGVQNTSLWPVYSEVERFKQEFDKQLDNRAYFLITDFGELKNQPQLLPSLQARYPMIAQTPDFILFNIVEPLPKP